MKIHNLTDVSTPALQGRGLVNVAITLDGVRIEPGTSQEFVRAPAQASRYQRVDALHVGESPPAKYLAAKAKLKPAVKVDAPSAPVELKQLVVESPVEAKDEVNTSVMADTEPPPRSRRPRSGE